FLRVTLRAERFCPVAALLLLDDALASPASKRPAHEAKSSPLPLMGIFEMGSNYRHRLGDLLEHLFGFCRQKPSQSRPSCKERNLLPESDDLAYE
ncbi:hypothetical protein, partial [Hydrogenimonas sp.]